MIGFLRGLLVAGFGFGASVASAGSYTGPVGEPVVVDPVDGFGALAGEVISWTWSWAARPETSVADFEDAGALRAIFTPDLAGSYDALLTIETDAGESLTTVYSFSTEGAAPVARVLARNAVGEGALIALDGSDSFDADGDALSYAWSVISAPEGAEVTIADPTAVLTEVSVEAAGIYVLGLTATDSVGLVSQTAQIEVELGAPAEEDDSGHSDHGHHGHDSHGHEQHGKSVQGKALAELKDHRGGQCGCDADEGTGKGTAHHRDYSNGQGSERGEGHDRGGFCAQDLVRNVAPVADARFDAVALAIGDSFVFDPYASTDIDGDVLDATFSILDQPEGAVAVLSDENDGQVRFTAWTPGEYLVELQVNDGRAVSADHVLVAVGEGDLRPVAAIAPVGAGVLDSETVLDGSQSYDFNGRDIASEWALISTPAGSTAALADLDGPYVGLTPDVEGIYIVQLMVTDSTGLSSVPVTQVISVPTAWPVAEAGADRALTDGAVALDGALSTGVITNFDWAAIGLTGEGAIGSFTEDEAGLISYTPVRSMARLDEIVQSANVYHLKRADSTEQCSFDTRIPADFAEAKTGHGGGEHKTAEQKHHSGHDAVTLAGRGTQESADGDVQVWEIENKGTETLLVDLVDRDGLVLTQVSVPGRTSVFTVTPDQGRSAAVEAMVAGETLARERGKSNPFNRNTPVCAGEQGGVLQLTVADGSVSSLPDTLYVGDANLRPVLSAGAKIVPESDEEVTLVAAPQAFDGDGDALSYAWKLLSAPEGSAVDVAGQGESVSFTPDRAGFYLVQLEATDGEMIAVPMVFVIELENSVPVAVAAISAAEVYVGESVTLDGTGSYDLDGNALTYTWAVTTRPAGSVAEIADPFGVTAVFTPDVKGSYGFELMVSDSYANSPASAVALTVPNRAPSAAVSAPAEAEMDLAFTVDASASSDPDGDELSYSLSMSAPDGAAPLVGDLGAGVFEVTGDLDGLYTLVVTVSDGEAEVTAIAEVTVIARNRAPILATLATPFATEEGLSLEVQLEATDPDGDEVSYFISTLPLADGMSLDVATGLLRFAPEAGQAGSYTLTVGASDGLLETIAEIVIEVGVPSGTETVVRGRVLDALNYAQGIETPLAGMPVRLAGGTEVITTDTDGSFTFTGVSAGKDTVLVEPDADGGPGGYLAAQRVIRAIENQTRDITPDILLTPLNEGCATVVAGVDTVLTGTTGGLSVTIAADTILDADGALYTGEVCLASLPQQTPVTGFPDGTQACQVYGVNAPGATFSSGLVLSAPNLDNLPETTNLTLWQQNAKGTFAKTSLATVDTGATTVSATANTATLFAFLPKKPEAKASSQMATSIQQLSPFMGDASEVYNLQGYTAFGEVQNVGLAYHSTAAAPRIVVAGDVTIAEDASLPVTVQTSLDLEGLDINAPEQWTPREGSNGETPALVGEAVTLSASTALNMSALPSGGYDYKFTAQANYDCSTVSTTYNGPIYSHNETDSPYGTGWSIDDLQTLHVDEDGSVLIMDDDSATSFEKAPTLGAFNGEQVVLPALGPQGLTARDLDGDGIREVIWADSGTGEIIYASSEDGQTFEIAKRVEVAEPNDVPESDSYVPNLRSLAVEDFALDGKLDVAYSLYSPGMFVGVIDDFADFDAETRELVSYTSEYASTIESGDFNGDGYPDLVSGWHGGIFVGYAPDALWMSRGSESGLGNSYRIDYNYLNSTYPLQSESGDVDGDGVVDWLYRTGRNGVHTLSIGRTAGYSLRYFSDLGNVTKLGEFMSAGDFNDDGFADFVIAGTDAFRVLINTTSEVGAVATYAAPVVYNYPAEFTDVGYAKVLDANGDGNLDIMMSRGEMVAIYNGLGDGSFEPFHSVDLGHGFEYVDIQDVNGDGSLDLVTSQRTSITIDFTDPNGTGTYIAGAGEFSELVALDDGTWERRYKDGTIIEFDASGQQTATVDTNGNRIEYTYDALGRIVAKTDQVGGVTSFAYDDEGRLGSITTPDGKTTEFTYNVVGQLDTVTNAGGGSVSFSFDDNGRLISSQNENGNESSYSYDATGGLKGVALPDSSTISMQLASSLGLVDGLGNALLNPLVYVAPENRVTTVTDRKGEVTELEVNQFGSVIRVTDPLGRITRSVRNDNNLVIRVERETGVEGDDVRVTEIAYDNSSNVRRVVDAVGTDVETVREYTYDQTFSKVLSQTDPDGFVTTYEIDDTGQVTKVTNPDGSETLFSYTVEGKLSERVDENGNATGFTYNADLNLETTTYADGSVTAMTYDDSGNTTVIAEAQGTDIERQVQRAYDELNRITSVEVTGADGAQIDGVTTYTYLPAGNLATVTDETGLVTTMTYDSLERLTAIDDPAEGVIQRVYNEAGEVIGHINGDGEVHAYDYDSTGRLIETVDPEGFVKSFAYDAYDNISTVTDGRAGVTSFTYDDLDRMVDRTNPLGLTMSRAYDARGNLTTLVREDGITETAVYDALGRRVSVETPDNVLTYAYDAVGNLTEAADNDSRVTFAYDARNRLVSTTTDGTAGPQPEVTLTYTYDLLDRRLTMSDSLGGTTSYAYDAEDRLTDLTAPWGTIYSFGYDGEGRRTSLSSTSGRETTYGYTNGLLSALTHVQSGVTLTDLAYAYGPDGQLTEILDHLDPTKSRFISYDALNRLVQVNEGVPVDAGGAPVPVEDYAYDEEGNRTASHLSALYSSNAHNQLEEDSTSIYDYDERGNRISRTDKTTGLVERYAYDSQNRLIGYANDTLSARYAYDALDRRIAKIIDDPEVPIHQARPYALSLTRQGSVKIEDLNIDGPFTFEGWIRLEPGHTVSGEDGFMRNGAGQRQDLNFSNGILRYTLPGTGAPLHKIQSQTAISTGEWAHFALTRDGDDMLRLYLNGVLDATDGPMSRSFNIGYLGRTSEGVSYAQCDDIRIWSVTRSEAEIAANLSTYLDPGTAGLERLYTFDDHANSVVDETGHSATAALGTGVTLINSTAPTASAPSAPLTPGETAEVTAYIYDMSSDDPLAHNDITLEFQDNILTRRWAHSASVDEPVGFEDYTSSSGVGSGEEHAMYADRQGSVIWVTNPATGAVEAAYEYDAYGQITQTQGALSQPYGYTGREYDAESGLYHYRARAYDPASGVFVQSDPAEFGGDGLNLFAYAKGNTFTYSDPTGLTSVGSMLARTPGEQATTVLATTETTLGAIKLAGNINQALYAALPFAMETSRKTGNPRSAPPGFCSWATYSALNATVQAAKTTAKGTCAPIPKKLFYTNTGTMMKIRNNVIQRSYARLAVAREVLAQTCFPGWVGEGDHSTARNDAIKHVRNCAAFNNVPIP